MDNRSLYELNVDFGRMGSVTGLFVSTESDLDKIMGLTVSLGEALGKHSDISFDMEKDKIRKLPVSSEAIEELCQYLGETWNGYNPFYYVYLECGECGGVFEYEEFHLIGYSEQHDMDMCHECEDEAERYGKQ